MEFLRFLIDNPLITSLLAMVLLVVAAPLVARAQRWRRNVRGASQGALDAAVPETRFMGRQIDLAVAGLCILVILALASWGFEYFSQ